MFTLIQYRHLCALNYTKWNKEFILTMASRIIKRKLKESEDETPSSKKRLTETGAKKSTPSNTHIKKSDQREDVTKNEDSAKPNTSVDKQNFSFFDCACEDLAKALLGQKLVVKNNGKRMSGIIMETEAYLGPIDKACHSYNGKRGAKNEAMYMAPGTVYVYNIYGMYCCINISSQVDGAAVLIRALEPTENLDGMSKLRSPKGKDPKLLLKKDGKGLCNGPSKLCQALGIKKDPYNMMDICTSDDIWLEKGDKIPSEKIVACKRININYAEEWIEKPLRFYVLDNQFVSVIDKDAEKEMSSLS